MTHTFAPLVCLSLCLASPVLAETPAFDPTLCRSPDGVDIAPQIEAFIAQPSQIGTPLNCSVQDHATLGLVPVVREALPEVFGNAVLEFRPGMLTFVVDDPIAGEQTSGGCYPEAVQDVPDIVFQCQVDVVFEQGVLFHANLNRQGQIVGVAMIIDSAVNGGMTPGPDTDAFRAAPFLQRRVEVTMPGLGLEWTPIGFEQAQGQMLHRSSDVSELMYAAQDPRGDVLLRYRSVTDAGQWTEHGETLIPALFIETAASELRLMSEAMQGTLGAIIDEFQSVQ